MSREGGFDELDRSLRGATFDLIETGGGAGSDTVISPTLRAEFCLLYDREMHAALHDVGLRTAYHTCRGMMHILDLVVQNGTDASGTLAPPGVGGNSDIRVWERGDPAEVRREVLYRLRAARGAGMVFQSDHSVASDVSGKTYDLMVKLVREHGQYPLHLPAE